MFKIDSLKVEIDELALVLPWLNCKNLIFGNLNLLKLSASWLLKDIVEDWLHSLCVKDWCSFSNLSSFYFYLSEILYILLDFEILFN